MKLENYLREVDDRARKATGGPWVALAGGLHKHHVGGPGKRTKDGMFIADVGDHADSILDKEFIAHSRQDIPKLIRLLKAAMEMRSQLRGCCDEFESTEKFDSTVADILDGKDG